MKLVKISEFSRFLPIILILIIFSVIEKELF